MPYGSNHNNIASIFSAEWRDLMTHTSDFIFLKDAGLRYLCASDAFAQLLGLGSAKELIGRTDFDIFGCSETVENFNLEDKEVLETGKPILEHIVDISSGADNAPRYCSLSKYPYRRESGQITGVCGIGRDVTIEYTARMQYDREIRFLTDVRPGTYLSVLFDITDWKVARTVINNIKAPGTPDIESIDEYIKDASASVAEDEDVRRFFKSYGKNSLLSIYNSGRRRLDLEYIRVFPDGAARWVRCETRWITNPLTGHVMVLASLLDIDDKKHAQSELARAVEVDSMTGLLNHDATIKHIRRYLEMEGCGGTHAFFMIDVDNFKHVNDKFGHQTGDDVITDVAVAISRTFRETDIVGRVGGDEFVVLMKNTAHLRAAARKASDLINAMQYDINESSGRMELSGSVGISIYSGDSKPFEVLYAEADAALYKAKAEGKNRYVFADAAANEENGASPSVSNELTSAVHLRTLLEDLEGAVVVCDIDDDNDIKISYVSPSYYRTFRRDRNEIFENSENMLFSYIIPEDKPGLLAAVRAAAESGTLLDYMYRVGAETPGEYEWRHIRGSLLQHGDERIRQMICILTDVTKLKQTEEYLKFAELRSRKALELSPSMLWEVDLRTREARYSGYEADKAGYTQRVFRDAPESMIAEGHVREESVEEFRRMFGDLYAGREGGEYFVQSKDSFGEYVPVRATFHLLRDSSGKPYYAIGIREPRSAVRELSLYRTLSEIGVFSVLMDDDLTLIYGNDHFYSIIGYSRDEMKERLGGKCSRYIHPDSLEATRSRVKNDILSGRRYDKWTIKVITGDGKVKYTQTSGQFIERDDGSCLMNGVIIDITERVEMETALRKRMAEQSLQSGPSTSQAAEEVKAALERGEFGVFLQPQYDQVTGKIIGAEALARWFRGSETILPCEFVPTLEAGGLILEFDKHIWESVCSMQRRWLDEGRTAVPVSVNMSRFEICGGVRDEINNIVRKYRLAPALLKLEIPEAAYERDPEQTAAVVNELRADGFCVEIDNFGCGSAPLGIFKDMKPDAVKLDMRILSSHDERSGRSSMILNSVVRLMRWLDIPVIAEGVETQRYADFLRTVGCTFAQGYYCARPMPADEFAKLLTIESTSGKNKSALAAKAFDSEDFWDAKSQSAVIFNSFVGAVCIVEYKGVYAEVLRANDKFYDEIHMSREEFNALNGNLLGTALPEDRLVLKKAIDSALRMDGDMESVCETRWKRPGRKRHHTWLKTRMKVIARSTDRYIFYVVIENISQRKEAEEALIASEVKLRMSQERLMKSEEDLRRREEELHLAMSQTGRTICIYHMGTGTLSVPKEYAQKHGISVIMHGFPHSFTGVLHKDIEQYYEFFDKMARGDKTGEITVQIQNADGSYSWEKACFTNVFSLNGSPMHAVIIIEDVTDEMERRAESERDHILTESMGSLIFDYDYGSDTFKLEASEKGKGIVTRCVQNYLADIERNKSIHPDDIQRCKDVYEKAAKAPTRGTFDYAADNWGTGYRPCRAYYVSIANESGRVYRMVGIINETESQ